MMRDSSDPMVVALIVVQTALMIVVFLGGIGLGAWYGGVLGAIIGVFAGSAAAYLVNLAGTVVLALIVRLRGGE